MQLQGIPSMAAEERRTPLLSKSTKMEVAERTTLRALADARDAKMEMERLRALRTLADVEQWRGCACGLFRYVPPGLRSRVIINVGKGGPRDMLDALAMLAAVFETCYLIGRCLLLH